MRDGRDSVRAVWSVSQALGLVLTMILLAACGGGGGGGGSYSTPPPSASLSYPSGAQTFTVGTAITPITPTITGTLSSFAVSPALPAGLSLDANKGTLSGTPTAIAATATYTISAAVSGGTSTSASLSITVNDVAPSKVSYGSSSITYSATVASSTLTPTAVGGAVVSWSINPALPAGLNFSTTDGSISGTPTTPTASASYVVTAQNSGGPNTVTLTIEVDAAPLLTLGHQSEVVYAGVTATTVFTVDYTGYWILWDYAKDTPIATGNQGCHVNPDGTSPCYPEGALAGSTAVTQMPGGLVFLSASDGHTLGSVSTAVVWWKLATDGSYIATASPTSMSVWSPSGTLLFSHSGDYTKAAVFTAPGSILVGAGPAGQNVIETIAVPSGTATTGPQFNGTFSSWFTNGGAFVATAGTTALVYSSAGVQQTTFTYTSNAQLGGAGNWAWTCDGVTLTIYPATGTNPAAAATYSCEPGTSEVGVYASGSTLAVEQGTNTFSVIDLSGAAPAKTDYTTPVYLATGVGTAPYAAVSASQWVFGTGGGAVVDGASLASTTRYFGYGSVSSIAGGTGYFAVATASGNILYFNSATFALEGTIPFSATKVVLSSDGTLLVADGSSSGSSGGAVNVYSLPAGNLTYTWPYPESAPGTPRPIDIELSGSGNVLGQVLEAGDTDLGTVEASAPTGGPTILSISGSTGSDVNSAPLRISPDGTLIAASLASGTNLYLNGSLVTAFTGLAGGWMDNSRLVVNNYTQASSTSTATYTSCTIYGPNGTPTGGACALPSAVSQFQPVTTDTIYVPAANRVLSVSTGSVTWMSGDPATGSPASAVAGSQVIFVSGIGLLAQTY